MIKTSKEINLEQLDQELGNYGLCADFNDPNNKIIMPAENSPVSKTQLQAAIDAHVAQPSQNEIIQLNKAEGILKLKELGFTDEQIFALLNG